MISMKDKIFVILATLFAMLAVPALSAEMQKAEMDEYEMSPCLNSSQEELMHEMRMLWEDHIVWTRMFIISVAENLSDTDAVTARLLQNYEDMEESFVPYYGENTSLQYGALLEDHLLIAADFVKAAKAGNATGAADAEMRWYQNADDIAMFLNQTNPYWDLDETQMMWHDHLNLTKQEAVARLTGDYESDIAAYDMIHEQALMMADELAWGIAEQFPDKFSKC